RQGIEKYRGAPKVSVGCRPDRYDVAVRSRRCTEWGRRFQHDDPIPVSVCRYAGMLVNAGARADIVEGVGAGPGDSVVHRKTPEDFQITAPVQPLPDGDPTAIAIACQRWIRVSGRIAGCGGHDGFR